MDLHEENAPLNAAHLNSMWHLCGEMFRLTLLSCKPQIMIPIEMHLAHKISPYEGKYDCILSHEKSCATVFLSWVMRVLITAIL